MAQKIINELEKFIKKSNLDTWNRPRKTEELRAFVARRTTDFTEDFEID